eukprot:522505-Prymnesium_polylepis.1
MAFSAHLPSRLGDDPCDAEPRVAGAGVAGAHGAAGIGRERGGGADAGVDERVCRGLVRGVAPRPLLRVGRRAVAEWRGDGAWRVLRCGGLDRHAGGARGVGADAPGRRPAAACPAHPHEPRLRRAVRVCAVCAQPAQLGQDARRRAARRLRAVRGERWRPLRIGRAQPLLRRLARHQHVGILFRARLGLQRLAPELLRRACDAVVGAVGAAHEPAVVGLLLLLRPAQREDWLRRALVPHDAAARQRAPSPLCACQAALARRGRALLARVGVARPQGACATPPACPYSVGALRHRAPPRAPPCRASALRALRAAWC